MLAFVVFKLLTFCRIYVNPSIHLLTPNPDQDCSGTWSQSQAAYGTRQGDTLDRMLIIYVNVIYN